MTKRKPRREPLPLRDAEKALPTTLRHCLRCDDQFPSTGPGNRLCKSCCRLVSSYNGAVFLYHTPKGETAP